MHTFFIGFESTIIFLIARALLSEISQSFVPLKLVITHFLLIFSFTQNLSCLFEIYCMKFVNLTIPPAQNSGHFLLPSLEGKTVQSCIQLCSYHSKAITFPILILLYSSLMTVHEHNSVSSIFLR